MLIKPGEETNMRPAGIYLPVAPQPLPVAPQPPKLMDTSYSTGTPSMGLSASASLAAGGSSGSAYFHSHAQRVAAAAAAVGDPLTPDQPTVLPQQDDGPKHLMINQLPAAVSEAELHGLLEQFGPVRSVLVVYDRQTGASKGYGFVWFVFSAHAARAMRVLNGFELYGKYLRFCYAVPQRPPPGR